MSVTIESGPAEDPSVVAVSSGATGRCVINHIGGPITVERHQFNIGGVEVRSYFAEQGETAWMLNFDGEDLIVQATSGAIPADEESVLDAVHAAILAIISGNPCQPGFEITSLSLRGD